MNTSKISFEDFSKIMSYDITRNQNCIEIQFNVDNSDVYQSCWCLKEIDKKTQEIIYGFGLPEDVIQVYDYSSFEELVNAKVFYGKSLKEIWNSVSLISIDASDVQELLKLYLDRYNRGDVDRETTH